MAIPTNTQIPKGSSQFAKVGEGKLKVRFLSDVKVGWELWKDKKPIRQEGSVCRFNTEDADINKYGKPNINYFWVAVVWNYNDKKVQILEITQKTIMNTLFELEGNVEWGDLKNYDIEITGTKEGDKVKYVVLSNPPKAVAKEIKEELAKANVDLMKIFEGGYPMEVKKPTPDDAPF